jgi:hypothetical protein
VGCGEYIGVVVDWWLVAWSLLGRERRAREEEGSNGFLFFFLSSFLFCFSFNR